MSDTTPKDKWVQSCLACLCPPSRPPKHPFQSTMKLKTTVSLFSPAPSPCVSFCHLFSRLRLDTSAKWVSLRRKRWPPADTSRWPPSPAPGQLHPSFSCTNSRKDKYKFNWLAFGTGRLTHFNSLTSEGGYSVADDSVSTAAQLLLSYTAHTNHFMRNMSSPVESVAPIILSGSSPRAKPLSFSVWGSNNKTATNNFNQTHFSIKTNYLQHVTLPLWV